MWANFLIQRPHCVCERAWRDGPITAVVCALFNNVMEMEGRALHKVNLWERDSFKRNLQKENLKVDRDHDLVQVEFLTLKLRFDQYGLFGADTSMKETISMRSVMQVKNVKVFFHLMVSKGFYV